MSSKGPFRGRNGRPRFIGAMRDVADEDDAELPAGDGVAPLETPEVPPVADQLQPAPPPAPRRPKVQPEPAPVVQPVQVPPPAPQEPEFNVRRRG